MFRIESFSSIFSGNFADVVSQRLEINANATTKAKTSGAFLITCHLHTILNLFSDVLFLFSATMFLEIAKKTINQGDGRLQKLPNGPIL